VVALQAARQVVPSRGNHRVLALEVLDDLIQLRLCSTLLAGGQRKTRYAEPLHRYAFHFSRVEVGRIT
jgi:hypothetical protein